MWVHTATIRWKGITTSAVHILLLILKRINIEKHVT